MKFGENGMSHPSNKFQIGELWVYLALGIGISLVANSSLRSLIFESIVFQVIAIAAGILLICIGIFMPVINLRLGELWRPVTQSQRTVSITARVGFGLSGTAIGLFGVSKLFGLPKLTIISFWVGGIYLLSGLVLLLVDRRNRRNK
jgi:hypothetical protein